MGTPDVALERVFDRVLLDSLLETLDDRDQTIVRLDYHEELTQSEIADRLGLSQCTSHGSSAGPPRNWPTPQPSRCAVAA